MTVLKPLIKKNPRTFSTEEKEDAELFFVDNPYQSIAWDMPITETGHTFPFTQHAKISRVLRSVDPITQTELACRMAFLDPEIKINLEKQKRSSSQKKLLYFQARCITIKDENDIKKLCQEFLQFFDACVKEASKTGTENSLLFPKENNPFRLTQRLLIRAWIRLCAYSPKKLIALENLLGKGDAVYVKGEFLFWGNKLNLVLSDRIALYEQLFSIIPYTKIYAIIDSADRFEYWKKAIGIRVLSR